MRLGVGGNPYGRDQPTNRGMGKLSRKPLPTCIQMKAVIIELPPRRAGREAVDSAAGLLPLERFKIFCSRGTLCREPIDSSAGVGVDCELGQAEVRKPRIEEDDRRWCLRR